MTDISPTPIQAKAIADIVAWYKDPKRKEFYLAGFAGVGKTTIANLAIQQLREKCKVKKVCTAAYTGKAALVLRRKGIEDAQTIHKLIYLPRVNKKGELRFSISEASPIADSHLVVLDECSMIDEKMAADIRTFDKKILIMGDPGQLPPVKGQGAFTNRTPDVMLEEIHRQAADSPILELATLARQGKPLPRNYTKGDVRVLPLTRETQPMVYSETTQAICGLNRVRWEYNKRIRVRRGFGGESPNIGEKIICCRNNQEEGIFNGGMGILTGIANERLRLKSGSDVDVCRLNAKMEDLEEECKGLNVDPYLFQAHFCGGTSKKIELKKGDGRLDEFDFGYILTCHKSQGSSWEHVTVVDDSWSFRENQAKWLYTALTRAETGLTVLLRNAA